MFIKAITICQPYASLIVNPPHVKRVENRSWASTYIGPVIIHAGKSEAWLESWPGQTPEPMPFGMAIGVANIAECWRVEKIEQLRVEQTLDQEWLEQTDHSRGPWCWLLRDIHRFEKPIACSGFQGFWGFQTNLLAQADRDIVQARMGKERP